jgi:hypothetical protein
VTEEQFPDDRCTRCECRLSIRQAVVDWVPVIVLVIKEVVQYLSS